MEPQARQALEYVTVELATNESRIYDHSGTSFRWIMATLFAANGGAILAILGSEKELVGMLWALRWFYSGMLLAILTGSASTFAAYRAVSVMAEARGKIRGALIDADLETAKAAMAGMSDKLKMRWWHWTPSYLSALSFGCLIGGAFSLRIPGIG
jgi:hypothetical protein